MAAYIEIIIPEADPVKRDLLVPGLEGLGFEGFEEGDNMLKAYIPEGRLNEQELDAYLQRHLTKSQQAGLTRSLLPDQNWNQQWESGFEPVIIEDFCAIRADFHEPAKGVLHELVITPKMSFGTGHHATTRLMIQWMRELPMVGKNVIDFGTGTGVLAILAEKLGASSIRALDNDTWSMDNARENLEQNHSSRIALQLTDSLSGQALADIVLANINRHVLLAEMSDLSAILNPGGHLLLSGILTDDGEILSEAAQAHGFTSVGQTQSGQWIAQLWKQAPRQQ